MTTGDLVLILAAGGAICVGLSLVFKARRDIREAGAVREAAEETLADRRETKAELDRTRAEKEQLEDQLRQARKLEAVGTLAGGVAHDFNNMLSIILGNAELAMEDIPETSPARQNLERITSACIRARDVVRQLLSFSRKSDIEKRPMNLTLLVKESVKLLRASIPSNIEVMEDIHMTAAAVLADPTQVHQILMNLCTNASHAMSEHGGILEIGVRETDLDGDRTERFRDLRPGRYVELTVSDTGQGIAPEIQDKIFDPYFTTKAVGEGTGMGLSVVRGIAGSHGGAAAVESQPGKGATFRVVFPAMTGAPAEAPPPDAPLPRGNERILYVDDEGDVADMVTELLARLGYDATAMTDPVEALERFQSDPGQYDLIMTDLTMPFVPGDRLAREILSLRPDIPVMLCTGFSDKITEEAAMEMGIKKYIEKPIDKRELARAVRSLLDAR